MPRQNLTDRFVAGHPAPGNYFDTTLTGLLLRVGTGRKSWAFVYRLKGGGPQWLTFGSYPALSLRDAREQARQYRRAVEDGHDPGVARRAAVAAALAPPPPPVPVAPVLTVAIWAKRFVQFQKGRKKTWADDEQRIKKYILPAWGELPLESITKKMVAELLGTIAMAGLTGGVTRIQMLISRMFTVAINQGVIDENKSNPAFRLIKLFETVARERVLSDDEIRRLWVALDARPGDASDALRLRLILGQRGEETAGMMWSELDLEARTWFMGGSRTKNKKPHLIWLPDQALAILTRRAEAAAKDAPRVFTMMESRQKGVRKLQEVAELFPDFTWKDLRRTFATRLGDLGIDDGVIGRLLNHAKSGITQRHYNHAKYLPEKQVALAAWDRELARILSNESKTSNVIPMPTR